MKRRLLMGMVGGGMDAFIGAVHRKAASLDGEIELVCGAFSSSPEKSKATGESLFLNPHRVYGDFKEMIRKEKNLPGDQRMDFVSIVTPNHVHFAPAKLADDSDKNHVRRKVLLQGEINPAQFGFGFFLVFRGKRFRTHDGKTIGADLSGR